MLGLTRTLALELGHDGITANCVAPAWTASDMTDDYFQQHGNLDEVLKTIPLGRIGQPEDIAKAVVYLASDASGYMSGETLFLAGGAI